MYNGFSPSIPHDLHSEKLIVQVRETAEKYLSIPAEALPFTKFRLFSETGSRIEYEALYMSHRKRLNSFAVMALYEGGKKWIDALCDAVSAVLDEFTWVLPAHLPAPTDKNIGTVLEYIDLFAAETSFALAEIRHLLSDRLPSFINKRIRLEINRRIIKPYMKSEYKWGRNNWAAVCAGSVAASIIYLDEREVWQSEKDRILASLETFTDGYTDDGACLEGPLYWQYGFEFFTFAAQLIFEYTGGKTNLFESVKVERMAEFAQKTVLDGDLVLPFSDTPHTLKFPIGLMHFLHKKYKSVIPLNVESELLFDDDVRARFCVLVRNFYWYDESISASEAHDKFYYLDEAQYYINKNIHTVLPQREETTANRIIMTI